MSFGDELRAARLEAGLSQNALEEAAGIAKNLVSGYETGKSVPSFTNLDKLEAVLGVRLNADAPGEPVTPKDVPEAELPFTPSKDEAPKPRKAPPKRGPKPTSGMPSLREQLEVPYRLAGTALATRMPVTSGVIYAQAGPCAAAWDQFLLRYPALREKIEQGAVAADIVNLIMVHVPILQVAREEIAAQQAAAQSFDTAA